VQNNTQGIYTTREQVEALLMEAREAASPVSGSRRRTRRRKSQTGMQKALRALANILYAVVIALLLIALYVGVQAKMHNQHASILGYTIYTVETGSMVPTLPIGSFIVTRTPENATLLPVGTVITFLTEKGSTVTHRIIEVLYEDGVKYRTKGDNPLNSPDLELVTPDRVLGTLQFSVSLPKLWQEQE
jgi:signal peptidase